MATEADRGSGVELPLGGGPESEEHHVGPGERVYSHREGLSSSVYAPGGGSDDARAFIGFLRELGGVTPLERVRRVQVGCVVVEFAAAVEPEAEKPKSDPEKIAELHESLLYGSS